MDQLGRSPALREGERAQAAPDQLRLQLRRVAERARPETELLVEERRVPDADRSLGPWRAVVVDHLRVEAGERADELGGVGDRGRGEQELRLRAVGAGEPAQAAEDVRDV